MYNTFTSAHFPSPMPTVSPLILPDALFLPIHLLPTASGSDILSLSLSLSLYLSLPLLSPISHFSSIGYYWKTTNSWIFEYLLRENETKKVLTWLILAFFATYSHNLKLPYWINVNQTLSTINRIVFFFRWQIHIEVPLCYKFIYQWAIIKGPPKDLVS